MKKIRNRSLRLESLEDRMLLAVTAGGEAAATELVAPAETGAEIVVNQLTYSALRRAINNANDGDTITFSVSGTIELGTAVEVWKNVTIDGGGQITLRGSGQDALLDISRSATLSGLTLENGYTSANGWGGVGRVEEGVSLVLNNCNIIGNTAETEANAAGAFYVTGQLYMNNCNVYGNTAVNGGFAFIYGRDNHGAALVDATNCTFYGNTASESGGVIRNMGGTVNLTNCTVVGNKAQDGAIANFEFFNVSGNGSGGFNHEYWISDTTITNSIIAYNEATDQATADIYTDYTKALYGNGALQWDVYGIDDTFTKIKSVNSAVGVKGDYFVAAPTFDAEGNLDFDALDLTIKSDGIAAYAGIGANTVAYTGEGFDDYLTVTTLNDSIDSTDGEVSLREAISYATLGPLRGIRSSPSPTSSPTERSILRTASWRSPRT